eukprot:TRINITY_DN39899_c0_g1_i1.p1 TRINITY_DN39899_c0_g1~~TRINITY_DN39899_c0_g1_i1.p1  ORF type:complete len:782 (-),score=172.91 TRINITY_DN39899_c0_g1_i1:210-2555(-)
MPIELTVADDQDGDNSTIGLSGAVMAALRVREGDYLLVRGDDCKQSVGMVVEYDLPPEDRRIWMNRLLCKNAGTRHLKQVTVCRYDGMPRGQIVSVAPFADALSGISIEDVNDLSDNFLAPYFKGGIERPLVRGQPFTVPSGDVTKPLQFQVLDTGAGDVCLSGPNVQIDCRNELSARASAFAAAAGDDFSPLVTVEVRTVAPTCEVVLPFEDILRSTKVEWVKNRAKELAHMALVAGDAVTAARTYVARGCGMKLVHKRRALTDDETFEDRSFGTKIELTVVLFVRTYEVVPWGDPLAGGFLGHFGEILEQAAGGVTRLFGNGRAFAALREGGQVVAWGDKACGGDTGDHPLLESKVINVCSNPWAFAALREGGQAVAWGDPEAGGNADTVFELIRSGVSKIFSTEFAFAALKADGSVVTWGGPEHGGDSSAVAEQLSGRGEAGSVVCIFPGLSAFAALTSKGAVVAWGDPSTGGDASAVAHLLESGVATVHCNGVAFAALKEDGSVVTWGCKQRGGDSSAEAAKLAGDVLSLFSNKNAIIAIRSDGSAVCWGEELATSGSAAAFAAAASAGIKGKVVDVVSNDWAFAARLDTGGVVTWGDPAHGGDSTSVLEQLKSGVVQVRCNDWAFAAILDTGAAVAWGDQDAGGTTAAVADKLESGAKQLYPNSRAFACLKHDGSVVAWGEKSGGGDLGNAAEQVSKGVVAIHSCEQAFACLKSDGSVAAWGNRLTGGASSSVATKGVRAGEVLLDVAHKLKAGVRVLHSNNLGFAALLEVGCYVL